MIFAGQCSKERFHRVGHGFARWGPQQTRPPSADRRAHAGRSCCCRIWWSRGSRAWPNCRFGGRGRRSAWSGHRRRAGGCPGPEKSGPARGRPRAHSKARPGSAPRVARGNPAGQLRGGVDGAQPALRPAEQIFLGDVHRVAPALDLGRALEPVPPAVRIWDLKLRDTRRRLDDGSDALEHMARDGALGGGDAKPSAHREVVFHPGGRRGRLVGIVLGKTLLGGVPAGGLLERLAWVARRGRGFCKALANRAQGCELRTEGWEVELAG